MLCLQNGGPDGVFVWTRIGSGETAITLRGSCATLGLCNMNNESEDKSGNLRVDEIAPILLACVSVIAGTGCLTAWPFGETQDFSTGVSDRLVKSEPSPTTPLRPKSRLLVRPYATKPNLPKRVFRACAVIN